MHFTKCCGELFKKRQMARLIEIDKSAEKRYTHKKCGAIIGYYESELKTYNRSHYDGSTSVNYFISCPNCKEDVTVKSEG